MFDVAVVGSGIIGTSAAAYLAEAGASVVLYEQTAIGAGASGRNSGAIQHPYDAVLGRLHQETVALYRELANVEPDFRLPADPDGILLVTADSDAAATAAADLAVTNPDLAPRFVSGDEVTRLEPGLAAGICGVALATGYAVAPAAATDAFARRAKRAGAQIRVGERWNGDRAAVGTVLVAAGPWTIDLVPGWASHPPISRRWGVVVTVELAQPPRMILEELGIAAHGSALEIEFSLMTAGGASSLGSTFLAHEPDPAALVQAIRDHGASFFPAVADADVAGVRACARPVPFDGRPLIGAVPGEDRLLVCAGHGPWGISTGPASARLVVDEILAGEAVAAIPPELRASRF